MTLTRPPVSITLPRRADRGPGPRWLRRVDEHWTPADYTHFAVEPMSPTIGAEIGGLDLREALDADLKSQLNRALLEFKVIVFRDQHLTAQQHIDFGLNWGEIEEHPFISKGSHDLVQRFEKGENVGGYENEWHSDNTWMQIPSLGSILRALELPPVGGDTLFADTAAAYDNLSDEVKARLDGLVAEHDWMQAFGLSMPDDRKAALRERLPPVHHPVVRTHPETGRKMLFVNNNFTRHIVGLPDDEGADLLAMLYRQCDIPEYQCRLRWRAGTIAFWDNRAVQHYAASDYWPQHRVMERIVIAGDRPY